MSGSRGPERRASLARLPALALALLLGAILLPFAWTVLASLAPESWLFEGTLRPPPGLVLDHYREVLSTRGFWRPLLNSLVVAGATTAVSLAAGVPAAYALARLELRGRALLLAGVLALSMFPQIALVSPLYLLLGSLGLLDTYPGLVLPYLSFALPLTVWLLVGTFRQLPPDLEDAARVDGAGRLRALVDIVVPLGAPGIAAAGIVTFVYCWNELLFALSFTLSPERWTVPVAIALLRGRYQVPWGQVLAAAVVATAPVTLLVLAWERRIVSGLTRGAVKG